MKKSLIKKIGIGLVAGALTFLPAKRVNSLENLIDGVGRINGNVIETINETPVSSGVNLKFKEYLGNGVIGDEIGSCQTDSNGNFSLDIDTSSNYAKVEISKSDSSYYQAERFVNLNEDVLLDIVNRHDVDVWNPADGGKIERMDFMQIFDMWCRSINGQTQRWEEQPRVWYLDITPKPGTTTEISQDKIDMAKNIIQNYLTQFSKIVRNGSFINNPIIEVGKNPPFGTNNWMLVDWWGSGPGVHSETLDGNIIINGGVSFNRNAPTIDVYLEELTQVLGPRTGTETRYFFNNDGYLESGPQIGEFLHSRPIGNRTPDIDPEPNVNIIRYVRPVTNLTAKDVPDDNGNQLELNWSPSVSEGKGIVSRYRIYRGEDNNFSNAALIDSVNVGSTSFIDYVPLNNTPYYYWVETVGNVDKEVVAKTSGNGETRFIEPPSNFRVSDVPNDNGHQLKLNWEKSPSEMNNLVNWYKIYRSRNSNGIERIRNLSDFLNMNADSRLDSLNSWDGSYAVLADSVSAGNTEYIDFVPENNKTYYYWLQAVGNNTGSAKTAGRWDGNNIGVKEESREFKMGNAYPNPFNASTTIDYQIPEGANVNLVVYDSNGRKVRTIYCGYRDGGSYKANWDGRDSKGRIIGNGIYFYELDAGKYNKTGKMMLVK